MATVSPKPSTARRPPSASPTPAASISRGATARSAVSPRVASSLHSAASRRTTTKTAQPQPPLNEDTREALVASLKQETDQKEQLLVQLQNKDQTITSLTSEVESLTSSLHTTDTRLNELYTEQARSDAELAQRIDIAEKLRTQVRELEKEKRDLQRRYNEQATTFEAERQAFYDNEQHLKSRIQSLSEALKRAEEAAKDIPSLEPECAVIQEQETQVKPAVTKQDVNDPENEPAEMTALKLELSTLSTSYSSLQSTLVLLQSQLVDLKRVNNELQEENESYMILLRERTLNGQFDLIRQVGTNDTTSEDEDEGSDDNVERHTDVGSLRSIGRGTLDRVDEEVDGTEAPVDDIASMDDDLEKLRFSRHSSRQGRKRTNSTHETRVESLADLPITGPGLDLAAELGRAENKDILEGTTNIDDQGIYNNKLRRGKKGSESRKVSGSTDNGHADSTVSAEMETMRSEIKSLKDANKALSLYASKIIDRIIAQEGFEHVLAADYENDKAPQTPSASSLAVKQSSASPPRPRPQSLFVGKPPAISSTPAIDSRTTSPHPISSPRPAASNPRANRRSLSFDWKSFSLFNNSSEKKSDQNLRPLTLKPGSSTLSGARKLETEEDEEDRKERERLNATMKLMGIQPTPQSPSPPLSLPVAPIERSQSDTPVTATNNRRFSLFGFGSKSTDANSDNASVHSTPLITNDNSTPVGLGIISSASLTQEALEHAEAQNSLAALDAHERNLSIELAKGGSGGFTEIVARQGRRSRRSVGGSGSTVWSAGMSAGDD
ncbi:hypothetical protein P691DRAFT_178608 [Macrolepiota fuliginosa MF-IS2]|uniref:Uncharacterized protein n=1 Tax=Macrolepiota fuliginosa MF-IS2 TaxID=1400762 RepID=A0A9P5XLL8_9AGAR|nr:hypothetical protein P691DRAFT_178608 [Macrolepiota fuliginosa MF-IS2]